MSTTRRVIKPTKENILEEANRLVHGDRGDSYGHPLDDFSRTAEMLNALFKERLSAPFEAEDVAIIMVVVKLSRQMNARKRDNLVDIAGYAETLDMVIEERLNRANFSRL